MRAFLSVCALLHSSILVVVVDTFVHSNQFCVCISHFTSSFVFVYECLRVFARVCVFVYVFQVVFNYFVYLHYFCDFFPPIYFCHYFSLQQFFLFWLLFVLKSCHA